MDNNKKDIELRSEKVRHIIGQVPPVLVRTGTMVITLVVITLALAFYTIRYPITIEAQGKVMRNGAAELLVPYKYLYLFDEPHMARITLEGQDQNAAPIVCSFIGHDSRLRIIDGKHYFVAKTTIRSYEDITPSVQPGMNALASIVVADKTLWQQVFKK